MLNQGIPFSFRIIWVLSDFSHFTGAPSFTGVSIIFLVYCVSPLGPKPFDIVFITSLIMFENAIRIRVFQDQDNIIRTSYHISAEGIRSVRTAVCKEILPIVIRFSDGAGWKNCFPFLYIKDDLLLSSYAAARMYRTFSKGLWDGSHFYGWKWLGAKDIEAGTIKMLYFRI